MAQVIVYQDDDGTASVVFPTNDLPIEEVAKKDVPAGKPYLVMDGATLPDWQFQAAWVVDFSKPDGVGLGHDAWAAQYNDPENLVMRNAAHAENAAIDMVDQMYAVAQQENAQFDALQALKGAS